MEENRQKNVVDNVENMEQSQSENEEELKEEKSILKGILTGIWEIVEFILLFGGIVGGFLGLVLVMLGGVYSLIGKVCPGILEIIGLRVARMGSGQLFEFVIKYGIIGLLINIGIIVASCLLILLVKVIPINFLKVIGVIAVILLYFFMLQHFQINYLIHMIDQYDKIELTRWGEIFFYLYSIVGTIIPVGGAIVLDI